MFKGRCAAADTSCDELRAVESAPTPAASSRPNTRSVQAVSGRGKAVAESTYLANLEKTGKIETKPDAALWTKSVAADVDGHMKDGKVVATSTLGELKASRVAEWIAALPSSAQMRAQIQQAPDSIVTTFVRQLARNDHRLRGRCLRLHRCARRVAPHLPHALRDGP